MSDILFDRLLSWWRHARRQAHREPAHVASPAATARVPPEYLSLYTYLEHRGASIVVLTFEQMESLLGFALPDRARTERDWWTGEAAATDLHCETWTMAQRAATPNLGARTVTFERRT